MEKSPWLRVLIILGVLVLGVQFATIVWDVARLFADILLLFVLAWMLAFILNPAVELLMLRRDIPRVVAVAAVYLGLLALVIVIGVLLIPSTAAQVSTLGDRFPSYATSASGVLNGAQPWLDEHHIPINTNQLFSEQQLVNEAQTIGGDLVTHALGLAQSVLLGVFDGFLILLLSVYFAIDGPRITHALLEITPKRFRDDAILLVASVDRSFGGYLRASMILVGVYAAGTAIAMFLLGVPFVLPISIFTGLMLIIPFVGDVVAVIPPVLLALVSVSLTKTVILLAVMIALQQLVLQVLRPRIMGKSVGLHALWVLFAFLAGARVAGIWGALFSVPVAAIIQTAVQLYYYRAVGHADQEGALARSLLQTPELRYEVPEAPTSSDDTPPTAPAPPDVAALGGVPVPPS